MRTRTLPVLAWTVAYLLLLFFWRSGFHLWSQVNDLYHGTMWQYAPIDEAAWVEPQPLAWFAQWPRMALAFPVVALARLAGWNAHGVFSGVALLLLAGGAWCLGRATGRRVGGFWIALTALSLGMNGRMLFGLAGACLLLWTAAVPLRSPVRLLALLAGLLLCSVSTGSLVIAGLWIVWLLYDGWRAGPAERWPLWAALVIGLPWLAAALAKNALYFLDTEAGVVLGLLGHGVGRMLGSVPDMLGWQLSAAVLLVGWRFRGAIGRTLRRWHPTLEAYPFLILSLFGGLFGYSTMIMAVPPALALAASALESWRVIPARG